MVVAEVEHRVQPVWQSMQGQRYCNRYSEHGAWVIWPCEDSEPKEASQ